MLLWIACAVLTAAVLAVVLRPLLAAPAARNAGEREADLAVYRDQLAEIEADHARGLINGAELEAARREVARRLLGVAGDSGGSTVGTPVAATSGGQAVALTPYFVAGLVPLVAIGLYITLGSPSLPSQPFTAANTSLEKTDVAILVERVEARLQQNPNDGQGWDVIAPIYFKMKRYRDAADAYAQAGRLLGETVARLGGFAGV